jgi:hypothetical protein
VCCDVDVDGRAALTDLHVEVDQRRDARRLERREEVWRGLGGSGGTSAGPHGGAITKDAAARGRGQHRGRDPMSRMPGMPGMADSVVEELF